LLGNELHPTLFLDKLRSSFLSSLLMISIIQYSCVQNVKFLIKTMRKTSTSLKKVTF